MTATEARALFLLIGPAAADAPEARAALRKLLGALPATFRADAQAAAAAVIVDPVGWGEHGREPAAMVEVLRAAVVDRRKVRLVYEGRGGTRSERLVDPLGLVDKDGIWYLVAGTPRGRRTFRVDRVVEADVTAEPAQRPDGVALADAWEQVVDEVERRRAQTAATATIPTRFVEILRTQLGRHCEVDGPAGDDRTRVRVTAPTARDIARHLAGWGSLVAVEKPPAVRAELARIGAELTAANNGDG